MTESIVPVRQSSHRVRNRDSRPSDDCYRHPACHEDDTYAAARGAEVPKQRNYCVREPRHYPLALCPVLSSREAVVARSRICCSFTTFCHPLWIICHDALHNRAECIDALAVKRKSFPSSLLLSAAGCRRWTCAQLASRAGPSESLFLGLCLSQTAMLPNGWGFCHGFRHRKRRELTTGMLAPKQRTTYLRAACTAEMPSLSEFRITARFVEHGPSVRTLYNTSTLPTRDRWKGISKSCQSLISGQSIDLWLRYVGPSLY